MKCIAAQQQWVSPSLERRLCKSNSQFLPFQLFQTRFPERWWQLRMRQRDKYGTPVAEMFAKNFFNIFNQLQLKELSLRQFPFIISRLDVEILSASFSLSGLGITAYIILYMVQFLSLKDFALTYMNHNKYHRIWGNVHITWYIFGPRKLNIWCIFPRFIREASPQHSLHCNFRADENLGQTWHFFFPELQLGLLQLTVW